MLLAPLAGFVLVVTAATGPINQADPTALDMSTVQKSAAMQPLVNNATECIARRVAADPRYQAQTNELGDLIVDSMPACLGPVRAMIDAYDRYYGSGSGETFFMGPYLDILPRAVSRWAKDISENR